MIFLPFSLCTVFQLHNVGQIPTVPRHENRYLNTQAEPKIPVPQEDVSGSSSPSTSIFALKPKKKKNGDKKHQNGKRRNKKNKNNRKSNQVPLPSPTSKIASSGSLSKPGSGASGGVARPAVATKYQVRMACRGVFLWCNEIHMKTLVPGKCHDIYF